MRSKALVPVLTLALGLLALTAAAAPAAAVNETSRSVDSQTVAPGGTATVTFTAQASGGSLTVNEEFSGEVRSAEYVSATIDGEAAGVSDFAIAPQATANGLVASFQGLSEGATVAVTYELTANESTGEMAIDGRATDSAGNESVQTTIDVVEAPLVVSQSLDSAEVAPGETVTVTASVDNAAGNLTVTHEFDPALANVSVTDTAVANESVLPIVAASEANGTVVTLENATGMATVTIEATVPENTSAGTEVAVSGDVTASDRSTTFDTQTVTVVEADPVDRFAGNDGTIDISDLGNAAKTFANGDLSIAELGQIASAFAGA